MNKPKIFPQEIMPLEDAPARYTKQVHLRLHTAHLQPEQLDAVRTLIAAIPANARCFSVFSGRPAKSSSWKRTSGICRPFAGAAAGRDDRLLGQDTYYAKVDTTLPERQPRRWERKTGSAEDEE